jgi:hypothetical protein
VTSASFAVSGPQGRSTTRRQERRGGGDAAAGEDDQRAAASEPLARLAPRGQVVDHRLIGAGEIDRQDVAAHFRRLVEDPVGHDLVVRADLRDHPAEDDAVDHAEGVIRDDNERAFGGHRGRGGAARAEVQLQGGDGVLPEQLGRPVAPSVVLVHAADAGLAGAALDELHQLLAPAAELIGRVAEPRRGRQEAVERFFCGKST